MHDSDNDERITPSDLRSFFVRRSDGAHSESKNSRPSSRGSSSIVDTLRSSEKWASNASNRSSPSVTMFSSPDPKRSSSKPRSNKTPRSKQGMDAHLSGWVDTVGAMRPQSREASSASKSLDRPPSSAAQFSGGGRSHAEPRRSVGELRRTTSESRAPATPTSGDGWRSLTPGEESVAARAAATKQMYAHEKDQLQQHQHHLPPTEDNEAALLSHTTTTRMASTTSSIDADELPSSISPSPSNAFDVFDAAPERERPKFDAFDAPPDPQRSKFDAFDAPAADASRRRSLNQGRSPSGDAFAWTEPGDSSSDASVQHRHQQQRQHSRPPPAIGSRSSQAASPRVTRTRSAPADLEDIEKNIVTACTRLCEECSIPAWRFMSTTDTNGLVIAAANSVLPTVDPSQWEDDLPTPSSSNSNAIYSPQQRRNLPKALAPLDRRPQNPLAGYDMLDEGDPLLVSEEHRSEDPAEQERARARDKETEATEERRLNDERDVAALTFDSINELQSALQLFTTSGRELVLQMSVHCVERARLLARTLEYFGTLLEHLQRKLRLSEAHREWCTTHEAFGLELAIAISEYQARELPFHNISKTPEYASVCESLSSFADSMLVDASRACVLSLETAKDGRQREHIQNLVTLLWEQYQACRRHVSVLHGALDRSVPSETAARAVRTAEVLREDLSAVQRELAACKEREETLENQCADLNLQLTTCRRSIDSLSSQLTLANNAVTAKDGQLAELQARYNERITSLEQRRKEDQATAAAELEKTRKSAAAELNSTRNKAKKKLLAVQAKAQKALASIESVCTPRPDWPSLPKSVQAIMDSSHPATAADAAVSSSLIAQRDAARSSLLTTTDTLPPLPSVPAVGDSGGVAGGQKEKAYSEKENPVTRSTGDRVAVIAGAYVAVSAQVHSLQATISSLRSPVQTDETASQTTFVEYVDAEAQTVGTIVVAEFAEIAADGTDPSWPWCHLSDNTGARVTDTLANFFVCYLRVRLGLPEKQCEIELDQLVRTLGRILDVYVAYRIPRTEEAVTT